MKIIIVSLRVRDQDSARRFYEETLGFTVTEDMDLGGMRWLTVAPPDQPELNVLLEKPGPPFVDAASAQQMDELVAKGYGGTLFFQVDDIRATLDELVEKGVEITQPPTDQPYGRDLGLRDPFGNNLRIGNVTV